MVLPFPPLFILPFHAHIQPMTLVNRFFALALAKKRDSPYTYTRHITRESEHVRTYARTHAIRRGHTRGITLVCSFAHSPIHKYVVRKEGTSERIWLSFVLIMADWLSR